MFLYFATGYSTPLASRGLQRIPAVPREKLLPSPHIQWSLEKGSKQEMKKITHSSYMEADKISS